MQIDPKTAIWQHLNVILCYHSILPKRKGKINENNLLGGGGGLKKKKKRETKHQRQRNRLFLVPSIKPVVLERSRWKGVSGSSPERTFSGNLEKKSHFNEATEFLQHLSRPYSLILPPSSLNSNGTLMWSSPSPPPSIKLKIPSTKTLQTQTEIWFTETLSLSL